MIRRSRSRITVLVCAVAVVAAPLALTFVASPPAQAVCDESEGCSPCGGPTLTIDGKNTRLEWHVC